MILGLISDTHNKLPEDVLAAFSSADLILHAGDIGELVILDRLKEIAPLQAVYGNTDIYSIASIIPSKLSLYLEDLEILLLHNIGNVKNFSWKIARGDYQPVPDIVVFGHTHSPFFQKYGDCYFVNPGSAALPRGGIAPTVMRLEIKKGKILGHELIKLRQDSSGVK